VLEGYYSYFRLKGILVILVKVIFSVSSENHYFY